MTRVLATSLVALLALTGACGEKKAQDKAEDQGQAPIVAAEKVEDKKTDDAVAQKEPEPVVQKLIELYPPAIGVYPLSAPDPGRSLFFGFTADGTQKFEMIWVYAVAAVPDFSKALTPPQFASQAEFDTFMEKWATEFKERPALLEALTKLQNEFSFKVDPAFMNDAPVTIPPAALAGQPNYVKVTQKFYARRYTTKAVGATSITAMANGATLTVPVTITGYTNAALQSGMARYGAAATGNPATAGCVGCHGNASTSQDAFLKHSSDYLAYATDAEILNIVKNATYPNGALLNNGTHKFTFAPADEPNIVGYLRSFPPSLDKLQGITPTPAPLRLR